MVYKWNYVSFENTLRKFESIHTIWRQHKLRFANRIVFINQLYIDQPAYFAVGRIGFTGKLLNVSYLAKEFLFVIKVFDLWDHTLIESMFFKNYLSQASPNDLILYFTKNYSTKYGYRELTCTSCPTYCTEKQVAL